MPLLGGCCCFDLKVGTKVIAIFKLVASLFQFITTGLTLLIMALMEDSVREAIKQAQARNKMLIATPARDTSYLDTNNKFPHNKEYNERFDEERYDELSSDYSRTQMNNMLELISENLGIIKVFLLVIVIILLLDVICSSFLIHGIRRSRRGMFWPWLALNWVGVVVDFLWIITIIIGGIYLVLPVVVFVSLAIVTLMGWGIYLYLVLVVTSQYQAMGLIILREDEMSMK